MYLREKAGRTSLESSVLLFCVHRRFRETGDFTIMGTPYSSRPCVFSRCERRLNN